MSETWDIPSAIALYNIDRWGTGYFTINGAGSGQGAHTNTRAAFSDTPDTELMDPTNGDLRLRPGSTFIDRGVPVANISDRPDVDFSAAAPDLGAVEFRP